MVIKTLTATPEQIAQLRQLFVNKYEKSPPNVPFHPFDLDRVRNGDQWLIRFLEMYDLDMKIAFERLWDTCRWRKENGINELNESSFPTGYLDSGAIFAHNHDVDGKRLLIFKAKEHQKGSKDVEKLVLVLVYWVERLHRETNMDTITMFFDLSNTSLSNVDLDLIKRMIETFKMYYPSCLNYILVYEMAWVLNAVFKIIKGLLPAKAVEILKTITKKDINTYIDKDNCLKSWGGNDDYQFNFIPEQSHAPPPVTVKVNGITPTDLQNGNDKKVHFANGSPTRVPQMNEYGEGFRTQNHKLRSQEDMLRVTPNDIISFPRGEHSESVIEITCVGKSKITYKIQTTSPEKFRVRPRCGILSPGETVSVAIVLKPDQSLSETKDKFNVMGQIVPDNMDLIEQVSEIWKQKGSTSPDVEQHRICCMYKSGNEAVRNGGIASASDGTTTGNRSVTIGELSKQVDQLKRHARITHMIITLTLLFVVILSGYTIYLLRQTSSCTPAITTDTGAQVPDTNCTLSK